MRLSNGRLTSCLSSDNEKEERRDRRAFAAHWHVKTHHPDLKYKIKLKKFEQHCIRKEQRNEKMKQAKKQKYQEKKKEKEMAEEKMKEEEEEE
ncbi:hypothetical protein ACLKA6_008060 [Drosophila palustris]